MAEPDEALDVWVNCASEEEAAEIARAAVGERLAACANIHAPIRSLYHWKGAVEDEREVPLLLKTRASLFPELAALIEALHSYETPGVMGIPVPYLNDAYLDWLVSETREAED